MGIAEKKAMREFTERYEKESLDKLKKASGNSSITVEFNFDEKLEAPAIAIANNNFNGDFVDGVVLFCEDADYREELAKISKYHVTIIPEVEQATHGIYGTLKIDGEKLNVTMDGLRKLDNGATVYVSEALQKLF